jgi:hypothetical protein
MACRNCEMMRGLGIEPEHERASKGGIDGHFSIITTALLPTLYAGAGKCGAG